MFKHPFELEENQKEVSITYDENDKCNEIPFKYTIENGQIVAIQTENSYDDNGTPKVETNTVNFDQYGRLIKTINSEYGQGVIGWGDSNMILDPNPSSLQQEGLPAFINKEEVTEAGKLKGKNIKFTYSRNGKEFEKSLFVKAIY